MTREDAISILNVIVHMLEPKYDTDRVEDAVDMAIKALEQEPQTGHWIVYTDCEGKTRRCVCDRCGYKTGEYTWKNPNFCANCGAKMEREG